MSSANPAHGEPILRDVRQLPANPSLEYERKEAKALLRAVHSGDRDGLTRVRDRHPVALRDRTSAELQLADAQHVIAREYGFASWPRLVAYFQEMERHRNAPRHNSSDDPPDRLESRVQRFVRRHQRGDAFVGQMLGHFVPRFFGRTVAEILATPITEDDARLAVARENRRVSWQELIERSNASREMKEREGPWDLRDAPASRAQRAIVDHDIPALKAIIDSHPELLKPSVIEREWHRTLGDMAVVSERRAPSAEGRAVCDFLEALGIDIQVELNRKLLGWPDPSERSPEHVRWYLDRGADPNWMPPNGISVIEHAIVRYRNGECADLIAQRVAPPRAFWIAAGLGDVAGMRQYIAGKGKLTAEARENRPDLVAMGAFFWGGPPPNPEADDLEVMGEAFQVAAWNERWAVMDVLLEAGFPIDHDKPYGGAIAGDAVANMRLPLAEYLVSRGADLDRPWGDMSSPREFARLNFQRSPDSGAAQRLLALCDAGTPEEVLAQADAARVSPPPPNEQTLRAMKLAADDAARNGQSSVNTENILIGILRIAHEVPVRVVPELFRHCGADMPRLRSRIEPRLVRPEEPLFGQELPADAGAEEAVRTAATTADQRRRNDVTVFHLLVGCISQESQPGARLLQQVGLDTAKLLEILKQTS